MDDLNGNIPVTEEVTVAAETLAAIDVEILHFRHASRDPAN
jgi:hypothetical protein